MAGVLRLRLESKCDLLAPKPVEISALLNDIDVRDQVFVAQAEQRRKLRDEEHAVPDSRKQVDLIELGPA